MRWATLAATISAAALASAAGLSHAQTAKQDERQAVTLNAIVQEGVEPAQELRVTSPPNAAPDRTYEKPEAALLEADMDYMVREGRRALNRDVDDDVALWTASVFIDDFAAGRYEQARATLQSAPGGLQGGMADMLEPFLLAAEGHVDRGVERVDAGGDNLPAPLPEVERGLVFESAGRLQEAAAVYAQMVERLDLTPPGEAEPQNMEEFERALGAGRVAHSVYRAALVHHRLGRTDAARRYYNAVLEFAPRSVDAIENLRRLDAGQQPLEPTLTPKSAAGRWMIFLAEFLTQTEALSHMLSDADPEAGLASPSGTTMLQLGLLLAPDASDWRLYAAQEVLDAGGLAGAERILAQMPADDVFAPDAEIVRAGIHIERDNKAAAVTSADRVVAGAGDRWTLIAAAADIYRRADRTEQAISTFDRALGMVREPKDRADVLGYRAFAHRFAGNLSAATADMRAAYEIDQGVDTRMLYVSILMDDPQAWNDGIAVARSLFAEQPDSVLRLNALGYALIQQPQGLEEGYRLLWRGFNYGQQDFAVVDSLGWAYYLYGHFDQARALIERARDLSNADEPNAEILDHLGDVYWRLNRREDARTAWRQALDADPDVLRRRSLEQKVSRGLTAAAPRQRELAARRSAGGTSATGRPVTLLQRLSVGVSALCLASCASFEHSYTPPAPPQARGYSDHLVGRVANLRQDHAAAADRYFAALERDSDNAALIEGAVSASLAAGDLDRARQAARMAPRSDAPAYARLLRASDDMAAGRIRQASQDLAPVEGTAGQELIGRMMQTWIDGAEGRVDTVVADLAPFASIRPYGSLFTYQQAMVLDYAGRNDAALAAYQSAATNGMFLPPAIERHAALLARTGARSEALALLQTDSNRSNPQLAAAVVRINAGEATDRITPAQGAAVALYGLATIFKQENDETSALAALALSLSLDAKLDASRILFAQIQGGLGNNAAAHAMLARIPGDSPYAAVSIVTEAWLLVDQGREEEALALARAAAATGDLRARRALADMHRNLRQYDQAEAIYSELIADTPTEWRLYFARGAARERQGRWPEAEADFQHALQLSPEQPDVMNYLGYVWVDRGENMQEGLAMIQRAVALRPMSGAIIDSLAWVYFKMGDYAQALEHMERAIELLPADATLNDHLGDIYWRLGRRIEARFQWQRALTLEPDDAAALQAKVENGLPAEPPSQSATR